MTDQQKRDYYKRFSRFQLSREKMFAPKFYKALRSQYNLVIDNIGMGAGAVELINPLQLSPLIESLYIDAATVYGAKVAADLRKVKARMPMGFSEEMYQLIRDYFRTDILNTSARITETTKNLIREVFTEAYKEGWGIDDIIKRLENTELSKVRARVIARTETVSAANQGAVFAAKRSGLRLNKEWLATMDNRTRRDHLEENGKVVGMDEYFQVGPDLMSQPGDRGGKDGKPKVSAKNVVQCRCTCLFLPVRENGKLVRN